MSGAASGRTPRDVIVATAMHLARRLHRRAVGTTFWTLALTFVPGAPAMAQSVIIDGKPLATEGKTVSTDGKYLTIDGRPVIVDGRPVSLDGKTVVIDGKTVSRADGSLRAPPPLVFTIDLRWLGASPYRIEKEITTPIERAVRGLPGVVSVRSSTLSGRAQTRVSFDPKTDASSTASALRNRLDQIKRSLPRDASQPLIGWSREAAP